MESLDTLLQTFYYGFCSAAKWLFAIRIASDILKSSTDNDVHGMIKSLISGGTGYGCLYSVVTILDSVQNTFINK